MTEVMKLCNGTPLQYSCLENPMDGGAWKAEVHGVAEGRTWLSDFTFTFHFHALEKKMATHSSVLAWRIPGMGEPGELPSIGSHRVGHNWSDLAAAAAAAMKLWPKCSCNFWGPLYVLGGYSDNIIFIIQWIMDAHSQNDDLVNLLNAKEMAAHSSTLAWKIPWTEKPGRLQSMGSRRVRHDWVNSLSLYFIEWP